MVHWVSGEGAPCLRIELNLLSLSQDPRHQVQDQALFPGLLYLQALGKDLSEAGSRVAIRGQESAGNGPAQASCQELGSKKPQGPGLDPEGRRRGIDKEEGIPHRRTDPKRIGLFI